MPTKKEKVEKKVRKSTISKNPESKGGFIYTCFEKGMNREKTKEAYKKKFGEEVTSASFAWYLNKYKQETGKVIPKAQRPVTKKAAPAKTKGKTTTRKPAAKAKPRTKSKANPKAKK